MRSCIPVMPPAYHTGFTESKDPEVVFWSCMTSSDDPRFGSPQWTGSVTSLDDFRAEKERKRKTAEAEAEGPDAEIIPLPFDGWESMPDATPITADTADPVTELRAVDQEAYIRSRMTEEELKNEEDRPGSPPSHPYYPQKHPYYPHPSETPHEPTVRGAPPSSPPPSSPPMPGPPPARKLPSKPPKTPRPPGAEED